MASEAFTLRNGIGLTGSIGVGKSTIVASLKGRGWRIIESDRLAKDLVRPGESAHDEIRKAFGDDVFGPDGELERSRLAEVVFRSPEKRELLENILHPKIRARWLTDAERFEKEGHLVAVDVPLLYEVGLEKHFEHIVVVACAPERQRERLRKRGWSDEQIRNRLSAQLTQQEKVDRADHVIWNDSSMEEAEEQLRRILENLKLETRTNQNAS